MRSADFILRNIILIFMNHLPTYLGMRDIFVNPSTGDVWQYDDLFSWPNLARTYEKIAQNGVEEFYSGETMKLMMEDLQMFGSIISEDDFLQQDL